MRKVKQETSKNMGGQQSGYRKINHIDLECTNFPVPHLGSTVRLALVQRSQVSQAPKVRAQEGWPRHSSVCPEVAWADSPLFTLPEQALQHHSRETTPMLSSAGGRVSSLVLMPLGPTHPHPSLGQLHCAT